MAQFKFQLQQLLEFRRDAAKSCEQALEQQNCVRERLKHLLITERDLYLSERNECNRIVSVGEVQRVPFLESALDCRKQRLVEILTNLREVEHDIEVLEQQLVQAKRDLKVIENLHEKRLAEFRAREEAKERKLLDEQAIMRHLRKEHAEEYEER